MIIPKEAAPQATAWQAPDFGASDRAALQVVLPTAQDIEAMYEQARQQGHAEGVEQGRREGVEQGLREGREQARGEAAALAAALQRLQAPVATLDGELETAVVALALELARQVVIDGLRTQPQQVLAVLQRALEAFPARSGIPWARMHPDDCALVAELAPELESSGVSLVPDPALQRGDLVLAASGDAPRPTPERRWRPRGSHDAHAELDLRLEERWRQVMARLFEEGAL